MPRIGPLLALSRDHHGALVIGRDAKRAAAGNDSAVWLETLARVEEHWRLSMAAHFVEEERLISLARRSSTLTPWHAFFPNMLNCACSLQDLVRLSRGRG